MDKILIIDDDAAILDALQIMFELEGYDARGMINSKNLYKMKKDLPDLILLDIWLSGEDGREICKYLKSNPVTSKIPVILISASNEVENSARSAGADDFICKPFEVDALLKKVKNFL